MTILKNIQHRLVLELYAIDASEPLTLPLFESNIPAGFPSPADDTMELKLDLNKHLIKHPSTTFYARVNGYSMQDAGIYDGDILIVDRTMEPRENDVVVCILDGDYTVKRVHLGKDEIFLQAANDAYEPIKVKEDNRLSIWGVVTYVIHKP
ncbi:LexA family protein [Catalinimonas niigatensis]|uniref:LexA family protein n=1 Tax=Catalinimonas niigatensis TaxID=1397264 RepID=UPI0026665A70|nr:translesion error-prone DNA polymerase V autoproteolytic subunit [Catalinimonas niigatensis]WPP51031.1 translesion error-prone DNA polymerase V autoproteolytic subunit [Catalinimonas niigatensis]